MRYTLKQIRELIDELESDFDTLEASQDELKDRIATLEKENDQLQSDIRDLEGELYNANEPNS